jgi:two-component sensor histidine kinase
MDCLEIGKALFTDDVERKEGAYFKFGENQVKGASFHGLTHCYYKKWFLTCLGYLYPELDEELRLDFYDDGCGLPTDFQPDKSRSLGLSIIRTLIEGDLEGSFRLENDSSGRGTHAYIVLPKPQAQGQVVASLEE